MASVSGCLFPRVQGMTGKNPHALPASLTGRIRFFCDVQPRDIASGVAHCTSSRVVFHPSLDVGFSRKPCLQRGTSPRAISRPLSLESNRFGGRSRAAQRVDGGALARFGRPGSGLFPLETAPGTSSNRKSLLLLSPYPRIAFCIARATRGHVRRRIHITLCRNRLLSRPRAAHRSVEVSGLFPCYRSRGAEGVHVIVQLISRQTVEGTVTGGVTG
jgi:hypothetical protein